MTRRTKGRSGVADSYLNLYESVKVTFYKVQFRIRIPKAALMIRM